MTQPSVYLDANVVIRLLEYEDQSVRAFLRQLHRVGGAVATSELTLAEALVVPVAKDDRDLIAIYENFYPRVKASS